MAIPKSIAWKSDSDKFDATRKGFISDLVIFRIDFDHATPPSQINGKGRYLLRSFLPVKYVETIGNRFKELGKAEAAADKILLYFWSKITDTEE